MAEIIKQKYHTHISSKKNWFELNLKEVWQYRDLIVLFTKRSFQLTYKQTVLGPLWYVLQPVLMVLVYMVVFGGIAGIPTDGVPQPLFYLAGTCIWQYFADCLTRTSNTFVTNSDIFGKVYFPRLIMPLSNVISNLLRFGIQFGLFAVVFVIYAVADPSCSAHLTLYALLFPILVLMISGLALGFGTVISSMTTKYRDLQVLFSFLIQLWMYATPIVYPLSQTVGKEVAGISLRTLMCLNPVTPIIETFKYGFLGAGEFVGWGWLLYSLCFMVVIVFMGIVIFNRVQRNFMDTV